MLLHNSIILSHFYWENILICFYFIWHFDTLCQGVSVTSWPHAAVWLTELEEHTAVPALLLLKKIYSKRCKHSCFSSFWIKFTTPGIHPHLHVVLSSIVVAWATRSHLFPCHTITSALPGAQELTLVHVIVSGWKCLLLLWKQLLLLEVPAIPWQRLLKISQTSQWGGVTKKPAHAFITASVLQ